jgi:hypothetical protein
MDALLTALVVWLAANFGLPASDTHPEIRLAAAAEIAAIRYGPLTPETRGVFAPAVVTNAPREVVAIYDSKRKTIVLSHEWNGRSAADLSVLVHELVHHLQDSANLRYECPAAREKIAYAAQEKWLGLFGRNLETEFEIDPFTLKVTTECGF